MATVLWFYVGTPAWAIPFCPCFFGKARQEGLRYVLKQELRYLPCLDIGGHGLPNVFVDRSGSDSAKAIREVSDLIATAGSDESVLIYPEGTRFTQKTRCVAQQIPESCSST